MRFVAGELLNFLQQARKVTPNPAFDLNFPDSRLDDGYADAIGAYATNSADPYVEVDLGMLDKDGNDNFTLDTWAGGLPSFWTKTVTGTGTVVETTVGGEVRSGSAAKLSKGTGSAKIAKTYKVRTGQRLHLSAWLRRAAAGVASLQIRDLLTGKYLTSASAWQVAQAFVVSETATSYTETSKDFTVEDYRAHADQAITYLELEISDTGAGGGSDFAFADDIMLHPHWNAMIVAGHNIDQRMIAEMRSSSNGTFPGTLEATFTLRQPSFFAYKSSAITNRWARFQLTGTNSVISGAPWYGELVITYLETGAYPDWGFTLKYLPDNIVNTTPGGKVLMSRAAQQRRRALSIAQGARSDAEQREIRDEIHGRCHGGLWPLIVVPVTTEEVVLFGRLDEALSQVRTFLGAWDDDLVVSDNPFPRVVPA